ncbi:MAG: protein-glutamate O-methyltransferase CheR [Pseudomonadota bacterium]
MNVQLTDAQYKRCREMIAGLTGIQMSEAKKGLVVRRLGTRMRALGIANIDQYLDIISGGDAVEVEHFTNSVTTNLTSFFRENHHFDYLKNTFLPEHIKRGSKLLSIWSAACSTGEEPYSIAMTLAETLPNLGSWQVDILATDIDTQVVSTAKRGVYTMDRVDGLAEARLKQWFLRGKGAASGKVRVKHSLQQMIDFRVMNLLADWPKLGPFDVIFCRNVVIYFDKQSQAELVRRFHRVMDPDGLLIMGHSESLHRVSEDFRLLGRTIYKRVA